tara:strand:+ start:857 stop:1234 length:378 start_codon:yes stop_codon:yes gene_type:complete
MVSLKFVPVSSEYYNFIRCLRNDEVVSEGFIEKVHITEDMQQEYMGRHKNDYFLCMYDGEPAGYVGVINDDVRVCTHPDFQRKGVGSFMLKHIKELYPNASARIKFENIASVFLFANSGIPHRLI